MAQKLHLRVLIPMLVSATAYRLNAKASSNRGGSSGEEVAHATAHMQNKTPPVDLAAAVVDPVAQAPLPVVPEGAPLVVGDDGVRVEPGALGAWRTGMQLPGVNEDCTRFHINVPNRGIFACMAGVSMNICGQCKDHQGQICIDRNGGGCRCRIRAGHPHGGRPQDCEYPGHANVVNCRGKVKRHFRETCEHEWEFCDGEESNVAPTSLKCSRRGTPRVSKCRLTCEYYLNAEGDTNSDYHLCPHCDIANGDEDCVRGHTCMSIASDSPTVCVPR